MQTLLEWLEDNRGVLKDGVYTVTGMGNINRNGFYFKGAYSHREIKWTIDQYLVKQGYISLIGRNNSYFEEKENKYIRTCKGVKIDVYDVLSAFEVVDPALQHLIKKALCAGLRGHKDTEQDLQDIIDSANRAMELYKENK